MKKQHREQIVGRARKLQAEIREQFQRVESWNDNSRARKEGCDPIDPDPTGELRQVLTALDAFLADEDARPLPPIVVKRMVTH